MGRHKASASSASQPLRLLLPWAIAALLLSVIAWSILQFASSPGSPVSTQPTTAAEALPTQNAKGECSRRAERTIAVPEEMETIITPVADKVAAAGCIDYTVSVQNPGDTAMSLGRAGADAADVWVLDSPMWAEYASERNVNVASLKRKLDVKPAFATSPLSLAVPPSAEPDTMGQAILPWSALFQSKGRLKVASTGLDQGPAALTMGQAWQATGGLQAKDTQEGQALLLIESEIATRQVPSTAALVAQASDTEARLFPATEQTIIKYKDARLRPLIPDAGLGSLEYALTAMPGAVPDADLARFQKELTSPEVQKRLRSAGFRGTDGEVPDGSNFPAAIPQVKGPVSMDTMRQNEAVWRALGTPINLLVLMDASGSMLSPMPGAASGATRIQVAATAAAGAMSQAPNGTKVALWTFSSAPAKGQPDYQVIADYRDLSKGGPKDARVKGSEGMSYARYLGVIATMLPSQVKRGADTGLFDTIYSALEVAEKNYDEKADNTIFLFTDGKDEDNSPTHPYEEVLAKVKQQKAAGKKIDIWVGSIGGNEDSDKLTALTTASAGTYQQLSSPQDMEAIWYRAMLERIGRAEAEIKAEAAEVAKESGTAGTDTTRASSNG